MKLHAFTCPAIALALALALGVPRARAQEARLDQLAAAAREAPGDLDAQLAYGRALIEAERFDQAATQMQKAVRVGGESPELRYEALRVKFVQGNYRAARAGCRELHKAHPDHVLSHVCMARAFLAWRRSSRALPHIEQALSLAPAAYEARLALADARRLQGQWSAAREAYEKALEARPDSAEAQLGLGRIALVQQRLQDARRHFRRAHELDPHDLDAAFELGRLRDGGEAVRLLEQAVAGRRSWPRAELALAIARLRAGQAAAAEPMLRAIAKREPKNGLALAHLGAALTALGRFEEAEQRLRAALELIPNDYDAALALARLYERTERHEEAFSQYRHAADLKREDPEALIAAAQLGLRLDRPVLAGAILDKALERAPRSAQVLALYGDALARRGEPERARELYKQALAGEGAIDRAAVKKRLEQTK